MWGRLLERSVLRRTLTVCSCAATSSMLFGRLAGGEVSDWTQLRGSGRPPATYYFSTHGFATGGRSSFATFAFGFAPNMLMLMAGDGRCYGDVGLDG